jgi:oligosaccharide repeat unit polymerase
VNAITLDRKHWLHPLVVMTAVWVTVLLLYVLRLSGRLHLDTKSLLLPVVLILPGFWFGSLLGLLIFKFTRTVRLEWGTPAERFAERSLWLALLVLLASEFLYSGYIPLMAKIQGQSVSHFEFGIPTVHGVVIAGLSFLITVSCVKNLCEERYAATLTVIGLGIFIAILLMNRKLFMVLGFQSILVAGYIVPARRFVFPSVLAMTCLLGLFGAVGELRSSGAIEEHGKISRGSMLGKAPSLGWAYLYSTTPLHNLAFAIERHKSEENLFPARTLNNIIPSVLRKNGEADARRDRFRLAAEERYWLESSTFNVSTAFIGVYLDWGILGIGLVAFSLGFICSATFCAFRSIYGLVSSVALTTACLLSVYADSFTNLNFVGQFAWLLLALFIANLHQGIARRISGVH